jgi:hypothetical protein
MRLSLFSLASFSTVFAAALALAGCGNSGSSTSGTTSSGGSGGSGGTSSGGTSSGGSGGTGGTGTTGTTTTTTMAPEGPTIPQVPTTYHLLAGAQALPKPGFQAGFGVVGDGTGTYQLVWTGNTGPMDPAVSFTGTLWTKGKFTSVTPGCLDGSCPVEAEDKFTGPGPAKGGGQYISFDATSTNDIDGIELTIDTEPLILDLLYNGQRQTPRVIYTKADTMSPSNPLEIPFAITDQ